MTAEDVINGDHTSTTTGVQTKDDHLGHATNRTGTRTVIIRDGTTGIDQVVERERPKLMMKRTCSHSAH